MKLLLPLLLSLFSGFVFAKGPLNTEQFKACVVEHDELTKLVPNLQSKEKQVARSAKDLKFLEDDLPVFKAKAEQSGTAKDKKNSKRADAMMQTYREEHAQRVQELRDGQRQWQASASKFEARCYGIEPAPGAFGNVCANRSYRDYCANILVQMLDMCVADYRPSAEEEEALRLAKALLESELDRALTLKKQIEARWAEVGFRGTHAEIDELSSQETDFKQQVKQFETHKAAYNAMAIDQEARFKAFEAKCK